MAPDHSRAAWRSTTIVAVRRDGKLAFAGDGQVTVGDTVLKRTAQKVRRMSDDKVLAGYAGSAADALSLFERLERKLEEYSGNLPRACLELVKDWRTDRALRRLEALLVVGDANDLLLVSGTGDLIRPDEDVLAIGSGGGYALAAARMLLRHTDLPAAEIAREALLAAAEICVYTNDALTVEVLE
ncbi:MAG: ATP-dependent protease subunit HslV [Armatimonadetes bacterium]|nr:ATP-dependent protease subunit HslV [Armatimonadota bacterium]